MSFWEQFPRGQCLPNCSCELMHGGWIEQPLAFWSSLAYLIAGVCLYQEVRSRTFEFKLWTLFTGVLTVASLLTHAGFTKFSLAMDFASIVLILSFFSFFNFLRGRVWSPSSITLTFTAYFIFLCGFFYSMAKWPRIGLCVLIFFLSLADLVRTVGTRFLSDRTFQLCLLTMTLSFGFFLIDEARVLCDPRGIVHGHTLWHFGTALSLYLYGRWRFLEHNLRIH